jgi:hypothetical protein
MFTLTQNKPHFQFRIMIPPPFSLRRDQSVTGYFRRREGRVVGLGKRLGNPVSPHHVTPKGICTKSQPPNRLGNWTSPDTLPSPPPHSRYRRSKINGIYIYVRGQNPFFLYDWLLIPVPLLIPWDRPYPTKYRVTSQIQIVYAFLTFFSVLIIIIIYL